MKPGHTKSDRYKQARQGKTKILNISCSGCGMFVLRYQKDGNGSLLRLYLDRITDAVYYEKNLTCRGCHAILGVKMVYAKEQRPAYRIVPGRIKKSSA